MALVAEASKCGSFGCVEWERNLLSWRKLGIGRMLTFLAVEGVLFFFIIALIEFKVEKRAVIELKVEKRAVIEFKIEKLSLIKLKV